MKYSIITDANVERHIIDRVEDATFALLDVPSEILPE